MTKRFTNIADDGVEKALRRGFTVPNGAVNLAWAKAPALSPKNNVVMIDTSQIIAENQTGVNKRRAVAYANALGVLEDENGNEIWDDEYPIISDLFTISDDEIRKEDYTPEQILPFLHVSRYFHQDFGGLSYGSLIPYHDLDIKVIDKNGAEHLDENGKRRYKIFIIEPKNVRISASSNQTVYRVHVFIDMIPEVDELFVTYSKVEATIAGGVKNMEVGYKERINPRPYFKYNPEESEVIDQGNSKKIYSSKPSNIKQQILGIQQQDSYGWKYTVPRKAIPDPRIFQLFRWRLACEFTQNSGVGTSNTETPGSAPIDVAYPSIIRAGVVIPPGGTHNNTRANFFFHQLNDSQYNITNLRFVNPLSPSGDAWTRLEQEKAAYWHVDLENISQTDLAKFDVLIWAPNGYTPASNPNLAAKIDYFTNNVGGTFIYETSSLTVFPTQLLNVDFTAVQRGARNSDSGGSVKADTLLLHDDTMNNPDDDFNTYGMWKQWPPNVADILHNYQDVAQILAGSDVIGGWTLTNAEQASLSGLSDLATTYFQAMYFNNAMQGNGFKSIVYGRTNAASPNGATVVAHKKTNSGGNIFVSTAGFFEDHLIKANGVIASSTMTIPNVRDLSPTLLTTFQQMISSPEVAGEMKLRFNMMLYATINKPSPVPITNQALNLGNTQSTTIYADWNSSWVINPSNGVLNPKEKQDYNFGLLPVSDSVEPIWQRVLSPKTVKQIIQEKIQQTYPNGSPIVNTFEGATRRYFIMVTNPAVQVMTTPQLTDSSIPTAWTNMSSPKFDIPFHLGSYVTRDEMVSGGIGQGDGKRIYPPKAYNLKSNVTYVTSSQTTTKITVPVTFKGTCIRRETIPETFETTRIWTPPGPGNVTDLTLHYSTHGLPGRQQGRYPWQWENWQETGIERWSDANYHSAQLTNFPYSGQRGRLQPDSYGGSLIWDKDNVGGKLIRLVQQALNQFIFFLRLPGPYLKEDAIYGPKTAEKVKQMQTVSGARVINGVVDSETWAIIGYGWLTLKDVPGWMQNAPPEQINAAVGATWHMLKPSISDGSIGSGIGNQSDYTGNPMTIKEGLQIKWNDYYNIYKVSVMPYIGLTNSGTSGIDWIDLTPDVKLAGYDYSQGSPGNIYTPQVPEWQWIHIPVTEQKTNSLVVRMTQSNAAGWGTARFMGIRDVVAYAKKYEPGQPGYFTTKYERINGSVFESVFPFTYQVNVEFEAGVTKIFNPWDAYSDTDDNPNVDYHSYAFDPNQTVIGDAATQSFFDIEFGGVLVFSGVAYPEITAGRQVNVTYNGFNNTISPENFVGGPNIGDGSFQYWTKNTEGVVDPYARSNGYIKKDDGIKLICKPNGLPYGFPPALPSGATTTMHFARYRLNSYNTDQTLYFGYYDNNRKEWVTDQYGNPEISYYDYIRRGPQNIFIGVMTSYELDTTVNVPGSTGTTLRPFRWAMPVYGVTTGLKPKIQLEPLSDDLGVHDLWPVPIRTGSFSKRLRLDNRSTGSLTTYLKNYQGSVVTAYYEVPEAKSNVWSELYGRPYSDISGEIPIIIDDDTIQIRQYPILQVQVPTVNKSEADPWKPIFQVYRRETLTSPWIQVSLSDIADFDLVKGVIILKMPLASNDPRLVKVDYTTERSVYNLKHDGTNEINLNPYTNTKPEWIDKPLYLYILPTYVLDADGNLIAGSRTNRAVRITTSPTIFNADQADYDPSAIMLGIIYISSAFDINDLILLDTRKRGGGVSTDYDDAEIAKIQPEIDSYWDTTPNSAVTYQRGGFIIVRLPKELKLDFTKEQIIEALERNISAGVAYQIEDLQGNRWTS